MIPDKNVKLDCASPWDVVLERRVIVEFKSTGAFDLVKNHRVSAVNPS
jgi:hypothetical protein